MQWHLTSPGGRCSITVELAGGSLRYSVWGCGRLCAASAPLGLRFSSEEESTRLRFEGQETGRIDETYALPAFKKSLCHDNCGTLALAFDAGSRRLILRLRAYDDGAAFRLEYPSDASYAVAEEYTAFALPEDVRVVIAMKHHSSYEDHYCPIPLEELCQNRLAMPILAEYPGRVYALFTEAAVFGGYGGSSLLGDPSDCLTLRFRRAQDKLTPIAGIGPLITPWRVIMLGTLADLVESNLLENLNPPSIVKDTDFIRPGLSAWSWMTENDSTTDIVRIRAYVDAAAQMGFQYYLADYGWPGVIDVPELVRYAAERGVGIWLWEHSADIRTAEVAEGKMRLWASWGVAGLKIDFFESDAQERMSQYTMLAETAARHRLMLNFHGCTKPAGEIRTWPHVLTREAVQGAEYLQHFSSCTPLGVDAVHNCTLPFTRNVLGPMDYTPVMYRTYVTGTTDAHQTALAVIFTSYIQHIGERAEEVLASPFRPFLSELPATWDETRLLEGYPGCFVTMARRSGKTWFVAGICACRPRNVHLSFDFLGEGGYDATLYGDDLSDLRPFDVAEGALLAPTPELCADMMASRLRPTIHNHDLHLTRVTHFYAGSGQQRVIPLAMNGGFVMILRPSGEADSPR